MPADDEETIDAIRMEGIGGIPKEDVAHGEENCALTLTG